MPYLNGTCRDAFRRLIKYNWPWKNILCRRLRNITPPGNCYCCWPVPISISTSCSSTRCLHVTGASLQALCMRNGVRAIGRPSDRRVSEAARRSPAAVLVAERRRVGTNTTWVFVSWSANNVETHPVTSMFRRPSISRDGRDLVMTVSRVLINWRASEHADRRTKRTNLRLLSSSCCCLARSLMLSFVHSLICNSQNKQSVISLCSLCLFVML